ncbi:site-specific tyrosine recombinase XerC [Limnobaculum parvum]|uniref:Recombinase XerD n=1 Tax=Limnobaculum parvum TaxID=2172103 RepID=A0A2Y9TVS3_9GAMM|nr:site-specific tyrosine recombinase XerC [Limnobaculum parvum]AWH87798.1 recombinase XerD [Limnobaculum parvum]AWH87805.1 recombinase XerD [Limnobaculum parvum]
MVKRRTRVDSLLTVDQVYRTPVGPIDHPKSLYTLLLKFIIWRRERNWSETTLKVQTHHLYHFILWANEHGLHYAGDITRPVLERYQRHLYQYRKANGEPLSSRTQRTALDPLKGWFSWMARGNLILANPAADLELPRAEKHLPRHIMSVEEIERVLAQADVSTPLGLRDRALMEVLWSTGIRRGEVAMLDMYSVNADRRTLIVRQGKGKKDRIIPIGERALKWVEQYKYKVRSELVINPEVNELFVAADGMAGLGVNGITNAIGHYIRAAEISQWGSCHLFRHAMATQMLENGADLRWIQAMLGHADVSSTQIYTQVSIKALQSVHTSTHPAECGDVRKGNLRVVPNISDTPALPESQKEQS